MRALQFKSILKCRDGNTYINSAPSAIAICGAQRSGIAARDWTAETVFTNEKTSPRLEIPRSIVKTMKFVNSEHLTATDLAVYWFLFGCARHQGIKKERHSVSLSAIAKFLGIRSLARIVASLDRLTATSARYDFNLNGTRRQQTQLINVAAFDKNEPLHGGCVAHYELPKIVREAVLASKDYAWVDINALARLSSKYSITLFIRLSYIAGQNFEARQDWNVSVKYLALQISHRMEGFHRHHLVNSVTSALAAIESLGKLHKRFSFTVIFPDDYSDEFSFTVGSSARRLREVRPADLPDAEYEKLYDRKVLPLESHQYPRITSLRQAATFLDQPTKIISDLWRTDVWGATNYNKMTCGLDASNFLSSIQTHGVESMFEHWVDKRGFPEFGIVKEPEPEVIAPKSFVPMKPAITVNVVKSEYDSDDDDLKTAGDYAHVSLSSYEPDEAPAIFDEVADDEIAF